jgi:hypothetical protein
LQQLAIRPNKYKELVRLIILNEGKFVPIGKLKQDEAKIAIATILNVVYKAIDNKTVQDDEQMINSIEFIMFTYSKLHPVEIKIAFDMHMAEVIVVEFVGNALLQKNISKVMNMYCRYRDVQAKFAVQIKKQNQPEQKKDKKSIEVDFINTICDWNEGFKKGADIYNSYLCFAAFDLLKKNDLIDDAAIQDYTEDATVKLKSKNIIGTSTYIKEDSDTWIDNVKTASKRLALVAKLSQLNNEGFNLREYLISNIK